VRNISPSGGGGRTATRAFVLAVALGAIAPLAVGSPADASTRINLKHLNLSHRVTLGNLPHGVRPASHIDPALLQQHGRVTVMLQLSGRPAIKAFLHPTAARGTRLPHSERVSAFHAQASSNVAQQRNVATHFGATATKATQIYTVKAGYNGIAVSTDASRLTALAHLPGVVAIHKIAALHALNNVTMPLIKATDAWAGTNLPAADTGDGVTIGIIDTGLDYTHADFGGAGTPAAYDAAKAADTTDPDPSSFDSEKFDGGVDLVGDSYDALAGLPGDGAGDDDPADQIPHPDTNPLDCNSHGTHVGGTSAGYGVLTDGDTGKGTDYSTLTGSDLGGTFRIGPGVAPSAKIFSVKVFGCAEGADSEVVPEAIDAVIQHNIDNPTDTVDVINMSLGGDYSSSQDPTAVESNNAELAGIQVVSAAGNAGDVYEILGAPGNAVRGIGVAASDDTQDVVDGLQVNSGNTTDSVLPGEQSVLLDWSTLTDVTGDLATTGDVTQPPSDTNNADGCDPITQDLTGEIAYFSWTDNDAQRRCGSVGRTTNAEDAGAVGAVFFDDENEFAAGINGNADIPAMLITKDAGAQINAALLTPATVNVTLTNSLHNFGKNNHPETANAIATFSSRGTSGKGDLKPDVAAPGQTVFSAGMGSGNDGLSDSGTSMATPHVAGVAALVAAAHPDWSTEQAKAAIMNTADQDVFGRDSSGGADTNVVEAPQRVGAGRVDAVAAVGTTSLAYVDDGSGAVSAGFGPIDVTKATQTVSKQVTVVNTGGSDQTYTLNYAAANAMPGASYSVSPTSLDVPAGTSKDVTLTLTLHRDTLVESLDNAVDPDPAGTGVIERSFIADASGDLLVTPTGGSDLRVPVYAAPRPASSMHGAPAVRIGSNHTGSLKLSGTGVANFASAPDASVFSTVDAFELQGTHAAEPKCSNTVTTSCWAFPDERAGVLRNVGFASDAPIYNAAGLDPFSSDPAGDGSILPAQAYIGLTTQGPWRTPASYEQYVAFLDLDGHGGPDAVVYNDRLAAPQQDYDYFVSVLEDMAGNVIDEELIDNTDGSFDTAEFNSDALTLPINLGALRDGLGWDPVAHPRISYFVDAFTGESGFTSSIGDPGAGQRVMSVQPLEPSLQAGDATGPDSVCQGTGAPFCLPTLNDDQPGISLATFVDPSAVSKDRPLGLLLLHHNNATGKRAQVVKIATVLTETLKKAKAPHGYRNPVTIHAVSNVYTPTGRVTIFSGRKKLGTAALSKGVAHFTLPVLAVGKHVIRVTYPGTSVLAAATVSKTFTVTKS
jgi:subtilisin family serine protease